MSKPQRASEMFLPHVKCWKCSSLCLLVYLCLQVSLQRRPFSKQRTLLLPVSSCSSSSSLGVVPSNLMIKQSPASLLIKPGLEARLECYHGDSDYPYMYWYQHKSAAGGQRTMGLVGRLHYESPTPEESFEKRFNITGHSKSRAQLVISSINPADAAEYFCAASAQCFSCSSCCAKSCWKTPSETCSRLFWLHKDQQWSGKGGRHVPFSSPFLFSCCGDIISCSHT